MKRERRKIQEEGKNRKEKKAKMFFCLFTTYLIIKL